MADDKEVLPGFTDEAHPEVFNVKAMLPQSSEKKSGQLSDDQIRQYFEQVCSVFLLVLNVVINVMF